VSNRCTKHLLGEQETSKGKNTSIDQISKGVLLCLEGMGWQKGYSSSTKSMQIENREHGYECRGLYGSCCDDNATPVATIKARQPPHQPRQVCKKEQGKTKRKCNVKPDIEYNIALKLKYNSAFCVCIAAIGY
jgi:hypothetical protein